jgi:hypothetical protein
MITLSMGQYGVRYGEAINPALGREKRLLEE